MDIECYQKELTPLHKLIDSCLKILIDLKPIIEAEKNKLTPAESGERAIALDFYNRSTFTVISLWRIFHPQHLKEFKYPGTFLEHGVAFIDFPSTLVLLRALFENYINMYYLVCENIDKVEKDLRILFWNRHAVKEKLFLLRERLSKENTKDLEDRIKSIDTQISSNELYKKLKQKKENNFIGQCECNKYKVKKVTDVTAKYDWSLLDTHTKADRAGINRKKSEYFYKYFSNYSHSGALSIDMVNSIASPSEARNQMILSIGLTRVFLSLSTSAFSERFGGKIKELVKTDQVLVKEIHDAKNYIQKEFEKLSQT